MTVAVTVGVVIIVILKPGILRVAVEIRVAELVVVSSVGRVVTMVVAEAFETMVNVIWGVIEYPRTSVHHTVSLSCCMMALACAIGSLKLDADVTLDIDTNLVLEVGASVVLELDANVVLTIFGVNVVKAIKEPLEETELESTLGEVLRIEELAGELLELEGGIGIVLEELPRLEEGLGMVLEELARVEERLRIVLEELPILEDRLCSEDDAVDEVLRFEEKLTGSGCSCGCACGCSCGCGRLGGPLRLAVGTTRDVWFPSNVGRTRTGFGKPEQEAATGEEILALRKYNAELRWHRSRLHQLTILNL